MIKYFEVNSETKIPVRISRRTLIQFEEFTKKGLSQLGDLSTGELSYLLFLGAKEGYRFLNEKMPYKNYESFEDILDLMDITDFFTKSGEVVSGFFTSQKGK
ncbi:hypothetical protein [Cyclobacterium plantarum]|uniref:Uncharacterized protein n=1 Tax=Cyclobacterium plantarum TaxID=2716263 RepID=A0ABX0H8G8_9BACT|nr:hypothetical protein [Cyclobacterium plantarum]NHE57954.1 hypothetical protein [Cyclobacterium plantarum]